MSQTEPREIADIKRQLIELEPLRDLPNTGRNFVDIVDWISIPPAYILKLLFFPILQFTDFGREDKVTWSTFFSYKGLCFKIRDFKFETWAIEGDISQPTAKELALQIRSKIEKACKKLDLILNPFLKGEI